MSLNFVEDLIEYTVCVFEVFVKYLRYLWKNKTQQQKTRACLNSTKRLLKKNLPQLSAHLFKLICKLREHLF